MPTLWIISDNKPGHLNQSLGLAQALQDQIPTVSLHTLNALSGPVAIRSWISKRYPGSEGLPKADIVISAGHRTHLSLLAARRYCGSKCVVIMTPSLPLNWFDLCLIPEHDEPPVRPNVVATRGPLNRVQAQTRAPAQNGLILVGGPSKHFCWSDQDTLHQIETIISRSPGMHWTLSTSRRTPASFLTCLDGRLKQCSNLTTVPCEQTDQNWLPQQLTMNAQTWVTADSASMVYEALTAGCAVGILAGRPKQANRIVKGLNSLSDASLVTQYEQWLRTGKMPKPSQAFNEATRAANWIQNHWLISPNPGSPGQKNDLPA